MSYVITDPCVGTCDTACVSACPVDAISGPLPIAQLAQATAAQRASLQLYIDPELCIFCGACEPECPVRAIFDEALVPAQWHDAIARNAAFFKR